jgi:endonuclease III
MDELKATKRNSPSRSGEGSIIDKDPTSTNNNISHFRPKKRSRTAATDGQGNVEVQLKAPEPEVIDLLDDDNESNCGTENKDASEAIHNFVSSVSNENPANSDSAKKACAENSHFNGKTYKDEQPLAHTETSRIDTTNSPAKNPFAKFAASPNSPEETTDSNPFAKFALGGLPVKSNSTTKSFSLENNKPPHHNSVIRGSAFHSANNGPEKPKTKQKAAKSEWIRMRDISTEEQLKIIQKWHAMADSTTPLEDRRFQVLVAARLHARCQEGPTRKAMKALRETFDGTLTVTSMAEADPEAFIPSITNLQYYSTKAKQLVKAAREIQAQFRGQVPEREHSLKQITGIGPVLADLLAFVNTRERHQENSER